MNLTRRTALAAIGAAALLPRSPRAASVIRIGYQRYSTLILTKHLGLLEKALASKGVTVSWAEFVAGPQLLQALAAGAIDLGQTGDAPPVFAEASQPGGLVYLGYEPPAPDARQSSFSKTARSRRFPTSRANMSRSTAGQMSTGFYLRPCAKPVSASTIFMSAI